MEPSHVSDGSPTTAATVAHDGPRRFPRLLPDETECDRKHALRRDTLVFKVGGKIFALASLDDVPPHVNLKCDPERALDLRDRYEEVQPGYHMNKKHWNTIELGGGIPEAELRRMIDHSYDLVVASLPKRG